MLPIDDGDISNKSPGTGHFLPLTLLQDPFHHPLHSFDASFIVSEWEVRALMPEGTPEAPIIGPYLVEVISVL